jgi:hypothetical protein
MKPKSAGSRTEVYLIRVPKSEERNFFNNDYNLTRQEIKNDCR